MQREGLQLPGAQAVKGGCRKEDKPGLPPVPATGQPVRQGRRRRSPRPARSLDLRREVVWPGDLQHEDAVAASQTEIPEHDQPGEDAARISRIGDCPSELSTGDRSEVLLLRQVPGFHVPIASHNQVRPPNVAAGVAVDASLFRPRWLSRANQPGFRFNVVSRSGRFDISTGNPTLSLR